MQTRVTYRRWMGVAALAILVPSLMWAIWHWSSTPRLPAPRPAPATPGQAADLDGDGRPDLVQLDAQGLRVISSTGERLLAFEAAVTGPVQIVPLGGPHPVLFAQTGPGEYAAFAFHPARGLLQAIPWPGGRMREHGAITAEGVWHEAPIRPSSRPYVSQLRLEKSRLVSLKREPVLFTEPRPTPAEALAAAVEAAALGLKAEIPLHFSTAGTGQLFYTQWNGKVPPGTVQVVEPDDVNAGAENGHLIPVTIWVTGEKQVVVLSGEARFSPAPRGYQIREVRLKMDERSPLRL